jgi:hypothetical protein
MTPTQALKIARTQDAYGKWNSAPAWNRYHALKRAQTPRWQQRVSAIMGRIRDLLLLAVGWAIATATLLGLFW